jgi:hypothetical protein
VGRWGEKNLRAFPVYNHGRPRLDTDKSEVSIISKYVEIIIE